MQTRIRTMLLVFLALIFTACDKNQPVDLGKNTIEVEAGTAVPVRKYSAEAFFETTSYSVVSSAAYTFSPDDKSVLITSDNSGVFNAYRLPLDGSPMQQLTTSNDNASYAVSWFPEDERILYTYDIGGNELNHIFVRETDGTHHDLTPGDELKARFLNWNSDDKSFYLVSNELNQKHFDIYRYSTKDYSRELIYKNPGFQITDISGDGRWIALDKLRTSADTDLYIVDLIDEKREPILITKHTGNIDYKTYVITPDNAYLILATDEYGEFREAWKHNLETGKKSLLVKAPWDVVYVHYSQTGRYQIVGINADARTRVTITDTDTDKIIKLPPLPPGDLRSIRFSADENHIILIVDADDSPSNIHVINMSSGESRQLTQALNPAINPEHLVRSEVVRYKSFDELEIPAILYKPHHASAAQPVPALVFVHGGPGGQTRTGYRAFIQHLVNHGYAILGANNRGSSGYGKTFYHLDDKRHGEEDLQDIVYGRKYLESLDWVDPNRIGVIGGSYGGYMVAAALAFESEVFDVGIDIFGVTNWVRTLESIPPWWEEFKEALYDEMGDPAVDAERHRRISPLFHAELIIKPILVVQGANDPRVLQVESDELVAAIKANDIPVEYLVFPDEGHGFKKRVNRIAASDAYVKFLETYLKGMLLSP